MLQEKRSGLLIVFCALVVSATHWGRADVELVFGDRGDGGDYILVVTESKSPLRYSLKRCSSEDKCAQIGKKGSYPVSEIREKMIELNEKKVRSSKNPKDPLAAEYLRDLIEGIERPMIDWDSRSYHHRVKGSVDQFAKTVEKFL